MSGTFRWLAMKAGTALSRDVSSLFFQLIYREIYRQIYSLSKSGEKTVEESYKLGYLAAEESAERQKAVFRILPSNPEKVLEFIPVFWQIYFGSPMQEYTTEWDRSDPERPILNYKIKIDPMSFEIGSDPDRDNLPFKKFWKDENGYGALMAGLLTQITSYVLKIRGKNERITLKNTRNSQNGDDYFEFKCQIFKSEDEIPDFRFEGIEILQNFNEDKEESVFDKIWEKITKNVDIDELDEMFEDSAGFVRIPLSKAIEKYTKMNSIDFMNHFTNDEEKFVQITGFIAVHLTNEFGQLPEMFFENETFAKIYAHQFLFVRNNAEKFIPVKIIGELKQFVAEIFEGIAPDLFVSNLKNIPAKKTLDLIFEGSEKALKDLGVSFASLESSIYAEFKKSQKSKKSKEELLSNADIFENENQADDKNGNVNEDENEKEKEKLRAQVVEHSMILTTAFLSIPSQLALILVYNVISGSGDLLSSLFKTIRDSGQKIVDLSEKIKELN